MSEFELGMMAGVVTAGAIAGAMGWWRGRNRVVTFRATSEPYEQLMPDDEAAVGNVRKGEGMARCPVCDGHKEVSNCINGHLRIRGPQTRTCERCNGTGVIAYRKISTEW